MVTGNGAHVYRSISVIWSVQDIWFDREQSQFGLFSPKRAIFVHARAIFYHII